MLSEGNINLYYFLSTRKLKTKAQASGSLLIFEGKTTSFAYVLKREGKKGQGRKR